MRQSTLTRQLQRHDPVATLIDGLLTHETENGRWFRLASQRLSQMNEESSR